MPFIANFVSAFEKCHFFLRTTNRNAKKASNTTSKKVTPPLPVFFTIAQRKNIDIALKFGMSIVCIIKIHIPVFRISKILDVMDTYSFFEKSIFFILGVKIEAFQISKIAIL